MLQPINVVVCGQSIAWAAVEAALHKLPNIKIINCTVPELQTTLTELHIDVVLSDSNTAVLKTDWLSPDSAPALVWLELDFGTNNLVEPIFDQGHPPAFADLLLAIQGEQLVE